MSHEYAAASYANAACLQALWLAYLTQSRYSGDCSAVHVKYIRDLPGEQPHLPPVHGWPEGQIVLQLPQARALLVVS